MCVGGRVCVYVCVLVCVCMCVCVYMHVYSCVHDVHVQMNMLLLSIDELILLLQHSTQYSCRYYTNIVLHYTTPYLISPYHCILYNITLCPLT